MGSALCMIALSGCGGGGAPTRARPAVPSPIPHDVTKTILPGVEVKLSLAQTSASAGTALQGTLTVVNGSDSPISVGCPDNWFQAVLTNDHVKAFAGFNQPLCSPGVVLKTGAMAFPASVITRYGGCGMTEPDVSGQTCAWLPGHPDSWIPPNLPAGTYETVAVFNLPDGKAFPVPAPIKVTLRD